LITGSRAEGIAITQVSAENSAITYSDSIEVRAVSQSGTASNENDDRKQEIQANTDAIIVNATNIALNTSNISVLTDNLVLDNLLLNADGAVNQRGYDGSTLAGNQYGYDMWLHEGVSTTALSVTDGIWSITSDSGGILSGIKQRNDAIYAYPDGTPMMLSFEITSATQAYIGGLGISPALYGIGKHKIQFTFNKSSTWLEFYAEQSSTLVIKDLELIPNTFYIKCRKRTPTEEALLCYAYYRVLLTQGAGIPQAGELLPLDGLFLCVPLVKAPTFADVVFDSYNVTDTNGSALPYWVPNFSRYLNNVLYVEFLLPTEHASSNYVWSYINSVKIDVNYY
jgi:hypothetical protein